MSAEYVRNHYRVDFKRGDRVTVAGRPGVVVSFPDQYVGVRLDGDKRTSLCHPTWRLEHMTERPTVIECAWTAVKANA